MFITKYTERRITARATYDILRYVLGILSNVYDEEFFVEKPNYLKTKKLNCRCFTGYYLHL